MTACGNYRDDVVAYLDHELESASRAALESHLATCEGCSLEIERQRQLGEALAALPLRQRQVVMLIHGYGWTQSEVAEVLGVSKPTVQTHLTRAVDALRSKLGVEQ